LETPSLNGRVLERFRRRLLSQTLVPSQGVDARRPAGLLIFAILGHNHHFTIGVWLRKRGMKVANWIKRFGFWGFLFFTVKGLLWLLVPTLIAILAN
jgi:hypothetical protein